MTATDEVPFAEMSEQEQIEELHFLADWNGWTRPDQFPDFVPAQMAGQVAAERLRAIGSRPQRSTSEPTCNTRTGKVTPAGPLLAGGVDPDPFVERLRAALLTTEQVKALPPPEYLVEGWLVRDSLAMNYGPSGVGKSFVVADIALHVSRGAYWQHKRVQGGPVVYVVAEGASGFGMRVGAWEQHNRMPEEVHPMHWLPQAVNIADPTWAQALATVCAELEPVLVVIDTFARCTVGAEENSARDVGLIIDNLDRIRRATGACVLLVHHSGKDAERGSRGSSALRGAMDTELELSGDSEHMVLKVTKQKDGPEALPLHLGLVPVAGTTSVAIGEPREITPDRLPAGVSETLQALDDIDVPGGVSATAWEESATAGKRTFFRHRKGLVEQGLVVNVGTDKTPRYRPATALEQEHE